MKRTLSYTKTKLLIAAGLLILIAGFTVWRLHLTETSGNSLYLMIACLSLIVAVISTVFTDILFPLSDITGKLVKAADAGFLGDDDIKLSFRTDEIGRAQNALKDLLAKNKRIVLELKDTNMSLGRKIHALEASKGAIGITDPQGRLVFGNQALFDIHGVAMEHRAGYIGKPALALYTEADRNFILDKVMSVVKEQGYWQGELYFVGMDGTGRYGDFSLTMLEDQSMIGTAIDITSRKVAEKEKSNVEALFLQAQKMEAIGRLTGGIAHDFNNMMAIVQGNLELLQKTAIQKSPKAQHFVDTALRAVMRSAELTSHLLSFSREQVLIPKVVSINKFLPEVSMLLSRALGEDIELVLNMDEDIDYIKVDTGQLETAILNLAINARDAMEKNGEIILSTRNIGFESDEKKGPFSIKAGHYVCLGIEDTGTGMPPEILSNIFDPFFTTKEVGKGTGLGLSMVYGFMKQSGGYITVDSTLGQGTNISLYFPVCAAPAEEITTPVLHEENTPEGAKAGKILIAEDEEDLLELNKNLLTDLGYNVVCATNGEAALKLLIDEGDIDLVLTDIIMPGSVSGRDLAREARKIRHNIKVLLVSGYAKDFQEEEHQDICFLSKPYSQARLAREINSMMKAGTAGGLSA